METKVKRKKKAFVHTSKQNKGIKYNKLAFQLVLNKVTRIYQVIRGLKTPGASWEGVTQGLAASVGTLCCLVLVTILTHRRCKPELGRELAVSPAVTALACHPLPGTQLLPKL